MTHQHQLAELDAAALNLLREAEQQIAAQSGSQVALVAYCAGQ